MATALQRRSLFKFSPRRNGFPPASAHEVLETGRDGSGGKTDVDQTGCPRPGIPALRLITDPPGLIFLITPIARGRTRRPGKIAQTVPAEPLPHHAQRPGQFSHLRRIQLKAAGPPRLRPTERRAAPTGRTARTGYPMPRQYYNDGQR